MPSFVKTRLPLILVLLVFIACKIPHLHYAYYWDECTPYAVAIKDMYKHGISIMPGALDPEISKGHPLLFHALAATWMKVFGSSHVAMHSFALTISLLLLIAIYETGLRLFNQRVALLALLMVALQEIFFVQSAMVLPEVLVAFFCFTSIVFYVKEKFALAALSLALLFYTKESGLVLGLVLGIDALTGLFQKEAGWKKRIGKLAAVGVPVVLAALFFVIQKHIRGWYLFPQHVDMVRVDWQTFWYDFRLNSVRSGLHDFGKYIYFILLMLMVLVASIRRREIRLLIILVPGYLLYLFAGQSQLASQPNDPLLFTLFLLATFYFLFLYSRPALFAHSYRRRLIRIAGMFILCFMCFAAINFFTPRYLIATIVPLLFITAVFFDMLITKSYSWLYYIVLAGIVIANIIAYRADEDYGDCNMGAFDGLEVQQQVVDFLESKNAYSDKISTATYLELEHLINPGTGFLHTDKSFTNVQWDIDSVSRYVLFDNMERDGRYEVFKKDTNFILSRKFAKGKVWAEIYEPKQAIVH